MNHIMATIIRRIVLASFLLAAACSEKKSLQDELYRIIQKDGIAAAVAVYHDWKQRKAGEFDWSEGELNALGYRLLKENKHHDAIQIFLLNVNAYPQSMNAYDSMAEAYMSAGQDSLAIEFYNRELEMIDKNNDADDVVRQNLKYRAEKNLELLKSKNTLPGPKSLEK